jgi:hypothetical protein
MKFLSDILAKAGLTVDGVVTLNNTATGQTPASNDNSTKLATTAWVRTFVQPYSLPIASTSILGGIKVGTGLSIDAGSGILSVTGGGAASIKSTQTFTATGGQTVFTITGGYIVGLIDIFLNGVYLSPNQTTATNGTSITLGDAALAGDIIDVIIASPVFQGATTTTDQLSEGTTNLYFTNARARAAISETVTGLDYNSSTGVLSITTGYGIPTTASQTTWDAAYNDKINSAAVTGTTTKTLTLTQQDGGTVTATWTDDNTDAVTSVFGRTGVVVAVSGDYTTTLVTEGTNLYYTDARARAAISVTGSGSYNSATGVITVTGGVTSVNTLTGAVVLTTTNIAEGTNLYYTQARFDTAFTAKSTTNLTEGTNLYYTTARANADFDTRLATKSTTNLAEGTNLYYTDARVGTYLTNNSYATQTYVNTAVSNLVDAAPGTLDTLNELAAALGDDPNFATTVSTSIGTKVPQTRTITINGTTFDLSANRTYTINSMVYPGAGIALSTGSAWGTSITDNSANWNTAFGWGNHASGGYLTTALAATTYASLTGAYANPAFVASLAYSKITGVPAFITSYTEVDTLATVTGRGASTSTAILINNSLSVNGGTVNLATYTSSEARIADSSIHLMKTSAAGIFEAVRAMNADTTAGTTVRLVAAATSDPFNNTNGGKVFIDAVRTATNMDLVFSLNDVGGAAPVERVRFTGGGNLIATGTIAASNYSGTHSGASSGTNTGDQTNISGNAATATSTPLVTIDNSVVYGRSGLQFAQSANTAGNTASNHNTPTGDWWHVIRMNHANGAGYYADLAVSMTTNLGLSRRVISNGAQLSNWVTILDALNYNSYSPTLTGTGASGTWGISITGNAATVGGYSVSGTVGANTVVIRDVNNYIYAHYINSNVSETENPTINSFFTSNGDGWLRKSSVAHVKSQLGLGSLAYSSATIPTNNNQLTNGAGYITGISSGNVTTALGYTPWNYGSVDAGRNIGASTNLDTDLESGGAYGSYGAGGTSWNAPFSYGAVLAFAFTSGIKAQFGFDIRHNQSDYGDLRYRTKNNLGYSTWRTMWHSGNLTNNNQLTNGAGYITSSGSITGSAGSAGQVTHNSGRTDGTYYNVGWFAGASSPAYSCDAVQIQSSTGTLKATSINAPSGYVSNGNPWGTANSAYFPNGITTAGGDNWIYGHTYVGNAPSNGAGHDFWSDGSEYHKTSVVTASHGQSGRWHTLQSAGGNYIPYSFESQYGDHSWGIIARFRINQSSDRPSIQFSTGASENRWNVGYCYSDDNFRITQNMGYRNDSTSEGWGTERFKIDTSGNITAGGSVTTGLLIAQGPGGNYNENIRLPGSTAVISFNTSGTTGAGSYNIVSQTNFQIRNAGGTQVFVMTQGGALTMSGDISGGYIFGSYFNSSAGNSENPTIGQIWTQSTGDNYLRKSTPAHLISQLGLITSSNIGSQTVATATTANSLAANTSPTIQVLNFTGVGGNSGNANQGYAIYQEGGGWGYPYPDLCIGYHTGIKIGAYFGYNGIRFYNNSDFATQTFSVNDGDNHVRVAYNLYVASDIVYNNMKFTGDQTYGFLGRNVYADTINGRGADPLELNYYDGGSVIIGTGANGSKALYAGSLFSAGSAVITAANVGSQKADGALKLWAASHPTDYYIVNNWTGSYWQLTTNHGSGVQVAYANSAGSAGSASSAGSAGSAGHLSTAYAGGQQTNPQVYFNNGVGLKAAMTGAWSVWSDTLWINGYAGGDVLQMCALHTLRNGTPRMAISVQASTSTSYGTFYEFITEYNIASQTVSKLNPLSGDSNYKLAYTADGARTNAGEWGRAVMFYVPNGQTYGIRVDRADLASDTSSVGSALGNTHTWTGAQNNFLGNGNTGGTNNVGMIIYSTGGNGAQFSFHRAGYYAINMGLDSDNVIRIGGWSASANRFQMDMSGNLTMSGDITAYSDARVKTNIQTIKNALDKTLALRGVTYNRTDSEDTRTKVGVIAQETLPILPEVVNQDNDGMYNVSYGNITALLIEAIKEQQTQIESQKSEIDVLKDLVQQLINR